MTQMPTAELKLRNLIREGGAIVVVGTGISLSATQDPETRKPHAQASWIGLLKHGLEKLKERGILSEALHMAYMTILSNNPSTLDFITIGSHVTSGFGGSSSNLYKAWLEETIGSIKANSHSLLEALHLIRSQKNLLATTNYDSLLLHHPDNLEPVTWRDLDSVTKLVPEWEKNKVLFLHGYWRRPETVVLGQDSYQDIVQNETYRDTLNALWRTKNWIYVGCGKDGLSDPDFRFLLERYGQSARRQGTLDFCLVRGEQQRRDFDEHFINEGFNIQAVSYGEGYPDLDPFLHSLIPKPEKADATPPPQPAVRAGSPEVSAIPKPPKLYAKPYYIGSQEFFGRQAELEALNEWVDQADTTSLLLCEAIGGNGKSKLAWEWTQKHATQVRKDLAGRFWYSFSESGTSMEDFCRHALAYTTGQSPEHLNKRKTRDMTDELFHLLRAKPWLFVLDGLERILAAYHRIDAQEMIEEDTAGIIDGSQSLKPCDAVYEEDHLLLIALSQCTGSKILVTSRLTPQALVGQAGQIIRGAKRLSLDGLHSSDAVALLQSFGIKGSAREMRSYLRQNCDNHPLAIAVLAGIINRYGPSPGNFDVWSTAADGGALLNLADLDLMQRRRHILEAAIDDLKPTSHELLATLSLFPEAVDYSMLQAFNPHLEENLSKRQTSQLLGQTIEDLKQRGLLQYHQKDQHYDLHAVVRGVVSGNLKQDQKERCGQRIIDYFSSIAPESFDHAKLMEDVHAGIHIVRTLLLLGKIPDAATYYIGSLSRAMVMNLEAHTEIMHLARYFFPDGWEVFPKDLPLLDVADLLNDIATSLKSTFKGDIALDVYGAALKAYLTSNTPEFSLYPLINIAQTLFFRNHVATASRISKLSLNFAEADGDPSKIFSAKLSLFQQQVYLDQQHTLNKTILELKNLDVDHGKEDFELLLCLWKLHQGTLKDDELQRVQELAKTGNNRHALRQLHLLRGYWFIENAQYADAIKEFEEAIEMSRERNMIDAYNESAFCFVKAASGELAGTQLKNEAFRLSKKPTPDHYFLSKIWNLVGDREAAVRHALKAYEFAWADGEPFVRRNQLKKVQTLFEELNVLTPELPPFDPEKEVPFPWEAEVKAVIEKLNTARKKES